MLCPLPLERDMDVVALLRLETHGEGPLHERIAAGARRAIADGEILPGERLPAARELAHMVDANVNTVLRAYRTLRDEGLIELRPGRGAVVRRATDGRARLLRIVDELVEEAARQGVTRSELLQIVEERR